ncbi:MAG: AsmA family protein, partial [Chitinophagaceae bacterium]
MKKFFKITGITLVVLIVLAFIIPVVFKKQIQRLVKKEINKSINAKVDFSDVKLSIFKHFPKVAIVIEDLTIIGLNEFSADTLLTAKKVDASAGLFNVLKGKDIKLYGLFFESPRIHALMNADGKANWDIAKASSDTTGNTDTSASAFQLTLKKYEISDGYLLFKDDRANTYTELTELNHTGSGDLTADVFTLSTKTKAASATLIQDDIPYLSDAKADIETEIKIDNRTNTYTFDTKDIILNDLKLSAAGFFQMVNDSTFNMDIKFESPTNDFKSILSMIPSMYTKDFSSIKSSGKASFNGFVKGTYTPQQLPAYDVNLEVKDGSFQYPDLPKPVKNIQLSLRASNPDGQPDNSVIDIPKGHLEMDNEPFDFRFIYKNPVTIQLIDAAAKGKVDLTQLSKFIKLENGTKLSGLVWADAFVKGPMQALQNQSGNFTAGGFFDIRNLYYAAANFPQPIKNGNIKATLQNSGGIADNTAINISSGHIEIGNDPLDFSLQLSKPMSAVNFAGNAKGRFTLDNIKQFTTLEPGTSISGVLNTDMGFAGNKAAITQKQYDKITLSGNASLNNFNYKSAEYPSGIAINGTQLSFNPSNISLSNMSGKYLSTNFSANGALNNFIGFLINDQTLTGNLNVKTGVVNLNEWMGTSPTTTTTPTNTGTPEPFLVPKGVNFAV